MQVTAGHINMADLVIADLVFPCCYQILKKSEVFHDIINYVFHAFTSRLRCRDRWQQTQRLVDIGIGLAQEAFGHIDDIVAGFNEGNHRNFPRH